MSSALLNQLRDRARKFTQSRFVRNVAVLAMGTAAAQAITLAFMPFLTRLYGPGAFGALAAFSAVVSIITPLTTLGYANAIVMPDTEEGAAAVARLSLVCAAVLAPVVLLFVHFFLGTLASWTGLEAAPGFLYLIPVSMLLGALLSVANQVAIREGLFNAKAGSHVFSTLLTNICKLAGGLLAPSGLLLIVFLMLGKVLNFAMLLVLVPRKGAFEVRRWFGSTGTRTAACEQRDFALYRMPQTVVYAAAMGLPVIMLTSLFGTSVAGQYSVTTLVLGAPIVLIGESVAEVFFPRITETIRENPAGAAPLLQRATLCMALIAVIPFGVFALWGGGILPWIFGEEWILAGEFSRWVALWMAAVLITRPVVAAMPAFRMQRVLFMCEVAMTVARVGALLFGAQTESYLLAVALFALVNVAGYMTLLLVVLRRAEFVRQGREYA